MLTGCTPVQIAAQQWVESGVPAIESPLLWPVNLGCCPVWASFTTAQKAALGPRIKAAAIDFLWRETGQQFNVCAQTVRPRPSCGCVMPCSCGGWDRLMIDHPSPHVSVIGVWKGTETGKQFYPATEWRVDAPHWLTVNGQLAVDGFPSQDIGAPDGAVGSWGYEIEVGQRPTPIVLEAANALACELLRMCTDQPCDVPPNAVSVNRDGVTIQLASGFKGIPAVAAVLGMDWTVRLPGRLLNLNRAQSSASLVPQVQCPDFCGHVACPDHLQCWYTVHHAVLGCDGGPFQPACDTAP